MRGPDAQGPRGSVGLPARGRWLLPQTPTEPRSALGCRPHKAALRRGSDLWRLQFSWGREHVPRLVHTREKGQGLGPWMQQARVQFLVPCAQPCDAGGLNLSEATPRLHIVGGDLTSWPVRETRGRRSVSRRDDVLADSAEH